MERAASYLLVFVLAALTGVVVGLFGFFSVLAAPLEIVALGAAAATLGGVGIAHRVGAPAAMTTFFVAVLWLTVVASLAYAASGYST